MEDLSTHQAICDAIGLLTQEAPLRKAGVIRDEGNPEGHRAKVIDQLCILADMFEPYQGDDVEKEKVKNRVPHPCKCSNCDHSFTRFWLPAEAGRVANMGMRGAFCPRCYATEGIGVQWNSDEAGLPMSFSAEIKNFGMKTAGTELQQLLTERRALELTLRVTGRKGDIDLAFEAIAKSNLVTVTTMPGSVMP
jgi:hypothetical protein